MRTYRDLMVWQKSMALVTEVYRLTRTFPKEEMYGLTSQMRRCAVSVPSNIAEGYGRNSTHDYVRFLRMAMGSLYELQTQMEIAGNLGYAGPSSPELLVESAREIERMMSSLIRRLNEKPLEESTR
ncbi:MAG: four helix bundle protein [Phycisphaerae bacterium]|nr:four helix bundle protein [Phycisphaerae bacterium]